MSKYTAPSPSSDQPEHPETPHFHYPITERVLKKLGLDSYLQTSSMKLTMIVDSSDPKWSEGFMRRTALVHERFMELRPVIVQPRFLEQRFFAWEDIHRATIIEGETAENTGLSLLVLLCKTEPVDLVLGVGKYGEPLVSDLKRKAAEMYPNQAQKFVTQAELEQEASQRFFAGEPDAFLLVAFERLYKTKIVERSSSR